MKLYTSREAAKTLGLHPNMLRRWADDGKIKFVKDVDGYLGLSKLSTICYCKVSSYQQRDDLERQVKFMQQHYSDAEIVKDVGSGLLHFKRKGLNAILERAMRGDSIKLVVAYRDRLARFGADFVRFIIETNGGKLVVLSEDSLSSEPELTRDWLNIIHVFSYRMHGLRKYKKPVYQIISDGIAAENI